jgi:glycosyltransferase involved in cell wall biosynthesis
VNREITIARVIARLNVGGPAIQAILMTAAFRKRGYKALLVAGKPACGEASMEYLADANEVDIIKIPAMSRRISSCKDLLTLFQLIHILRRHKPVIVHTHTAKAGTLGRLAAMILRVPVRVHTFHGHIFKGYFSLRLTRVFLLIERFLARHTDCIVAVSESQKRELSEIYRIAPADKIAVIPLGLDLGRFLRVNGRSGLLNSPVNANQPTALVGWVGRLTPIKDPLFFLRSAALLNHSVPATRFVMVGDGELRQQCEQIIARHQLDNLASLLGWRRDLPQIYADLDIVVSTSLNEGTPVALLESMAAARPIISTDVGGVRDLMVGNARFLAGLEIFENGILVKRDANLLALAIRYLLQRPHERRAMGEAGREFVRNQFSQSRLADDLEELYLSLARSKGLLPSNLASPAHQPEAAPSHPIPL